MIQDTSNVTMYDGETRRACDVENGAVLSFSGIKPTKAVVTERRMENRQDVVGLILSTGRRFCGSQDQRVAVLRPHNIVFRPLSDVESGDVLRGEEGGLAINIRVFGLLIYPHKEARLVEFQIENGKPFVAEGVLCRS